MTSYTASEKTSYNNYAEVYMTETKISGESVMSYVCYRGVGSSTISMKRCYHTNFSRGHSIADFRLQPCQKNSVVFPTAARLPDNAQPVMFEAGKNLKTATIVGQYGEHDAKPQNEITATVKALLRSVGVPGARYAHESSTTRHELDTSESEKFHFH